MKKLGLILFVVSFVPWAAIAFVVPFLQITLAQKALLIPILLLIAEILFWLSLALLGKEVVTKYRRYLNFRSLWKQLKKFWHKLKR